MDLGEAMPLLQLRVDALGDEFAVARGRPVAHQDGGLAVVGVWVGGVGGVEGRGRGL